ATDALIRAIDENASPPAAQQRFTTCERLPLAEFPIPAYELIEGRRYFIGSVQFSSGCPYRCEFCDIPALYGRQPRIKSPQQILTELAALDAMQKSQNRAVPLLDAVATINSYGIEVVSGIILGLDTDTPQTADRLIEFIDRSQIPMLTINLLQALPKTPLWDRLQAAGRLDEDSGRESNDVFVRPYEEVLHNWRRSIRHAYTPEAIYRRFAWNAEHTYINRIALPLSQARLNLGNLRRAFGIITRLLVRVGLFGDYRRSFWQMAWPALRAGRIEELIHVGIGDGEIVAEQVGAAAECALKHAQRLRQLLLGGFRRRSIALVLGKNGAVEQRRQHRPLDLRHPPEAPLPRPRLVLEPGRVELA